MVTFIPKCEKIGEGLETDQTYAIHSKNKKLLDRHIRYVGTNVSIEQI